MGATKFPAAPALFVRVMISRLSRGREAARETKSSAWKGGGSHDEVDASEFLGASLGSVDKSLRLRDPKVGISTWKNSVPASSKASNRKEEEDTYIANVTPTDADDFGAGPSRGNVGSDALRLLDVAADDDGIGAQGNKGARLRRAD